MVIFLVALFVLVWLAALVMGFVYSAKLRTVAPEIAAEFSPTLASAFKGWKATRFLIGGGFRVVNNQGFVRFCEAYRVVVLGMWLLLVLLPLTLVINA